jgi:hypothetical protein
MAYTITASDSSVTINIPDGTSDSSTSLTLAGPNYVGYGQQLNQNLINLLTSFSSNTQPTGAHIQGQLWFDKVNQSLNVYVNNTVGFSPVNGIIVDSSQPSDVVPGTLWFNTSTSQLFVYNNNNSFTLIGPLYTSQQGVSGAIPVTLTDFASLSYNVIQLQFGGQILAIFAETSFIPVPAIPGFSTIYPGLNVNTTLNALTQGQYYSNANVASYLPTDPTIQSIIGNISTITNNVTTLETGSYTMGNYQNWHGNVSTISSALDQIASRLKAAGL